MKWGGKGREVQEQSILMAISRGVRGLFIVPLVNVFHVSSDPRDIPLNEMRCSWQTILTVVVVLCLFSVYSNGSMGKIECSNGKS